MSKSLTIVALLASLTLGGCLGGTGAGEIVDLSAYQRGKFHFNAGQFGLAVGHFQSAVRREPDSVEALNGLAASYDKLGRYDLSARYYERALAADPESAQTLNNIGYSYLLQERFDLAVAYLRDAQSRDRKDPVVLANRKTAEGSYQETDLRRSAQEARMRAAAPASTPSRPQVAARAPAAPVASSRRVKPWIERTAPRIQTLVTQPQFALLSAVQEAGIDPQVAAYRPQQPKASELLPDHAAAPMMLGVPAPSERGGAIRQQEVRSAPKALAELPAELPNRIDATRSAPIEVMVASLDPSPDLSDVAPSQGQPASVATTELVAPEVVLGDLDPLDAIEDDNALEAGNALPQEAAPEAVEVEVASLGAVVPDTPRVDAPFAVAGNLPLVEVSNGTGRPNMAARIRDYLEAKGMVVKRLTNAEDYRHQETIIFYRSGWRAYAEELARMLPAAIDLDDRPGQESDVRLELGGDLLDFDRGLYYAVKRYNDGIRG